MDNYARFEILITKNTIILSHFTWVYAGDNGKKYNLSLYHGSNTGHILLTCNLSILLIDFSVLRSKTYSFFLGDELCELQLERKGNKFYYDLNINETADTPRNRARKKIEKRHFNQTLIFFGGLLFFIAIVVFFLLRYQ